MASYRADLPPLPKRWGHLPLSDKGYPVPWFVGQVDGKPDFRVVRPHGYLEAYKANVCWLCGHPLGVLKACVVGPMCGVNRVTSEPASHYECANYAVRACPFLTRPAAVRRERDMPAGGTMAGEGIKRNPGATLIWITKLLMPFKVSNGILFRLGAPERVEFWREGRNATRAEIDSAVSSGLPTLQAMAAKQGPPAVDALASQVNTLTTLLDAWLPHAATG